ncbi:MAG TPA: glycosyltransferase [Rubricoccaceae bacterium]|jgi:glycosyltransferase involved in cell wall biosynthesis
MRALHVLVAIDSLDPGGAETYAVQLVNSLDERGIAVTLAAGENNGNRLEGTVRPGVQRLALPWRWRPSKAAQVRSLWGAAAAIDRHTRAHGVTAIQTLLPTTMIAGWLGARRARVPVAHTPMQVAGNAHRAERTVNRLLLPRMDLVVALGDYLYDDTRRAYATRAERTVVCRLGVDVDRYTPAGRAAARAALGLPDDLPTVGICTGLRPIKDPMLALRAFAALRARRPAAFVIVGDGAMRAEMEAFVAAHSLTADVHFAGHRADVRDAVPAFDVYLETCHGPNLGLAPLETLAMGVPLIVAARDADEARMAADTLVDGSAGAVAKADPDALAAALDTFFARSPEARAETTAAARRTAELHYRWDGHVDALVGHYTRLAR